MFKKLTRREKTALFVAAGAICFLIVMQGIVFPAFDKRQRLERTLDAKIRMLQEMAVLKSEHDALTRETTLSKELFGNREKGFTLFSFLDRLTGDAGIKDRINYMKPSTLVQKNSPYKTSTVEMKIQGITIKQLILYLHKVETSKNGVFVTRLSISKTGDTQGFIDALLQVETTEL